MSFFGKNITQLTNTILQNWHGLIKPYVITTIAIGTSVTTGDLICQYLESRKVDTNDKTRAASTSSMLSWWDSERSRVMGTTAVLVSTPWSFTFAHLLERLFPGNQGSQILKKILTNSLLSPINISLVFTSIILLQGHSLRVAGRKIRNDMPKTFAVGSCYWPFVSYFNFRFMPVDYRPIVGSLAGAVWNIYMSSAGNNPKLNPDGTIKATGGTGTTMLAETGGSTVPAMQEAWKTMNKNKKIL